MAITEIKLFLPILRVLKHAIKNILMGINFPLLLLCYFLGILFINFFAVKKQQLDLCTREGS